MGEFTAKLRFVAVLAAAASCINVVVAWCDAWCSPLMTMHAIRANPDATSPWRTIGGWYVRVDPAGWPCPAFDGHTWGLGEYDGLRSSRSHVSDGFLFLWRERPGHPWHAHVARHIPLIPRWSGFAANTCIYTLLLLCLRYPFVARQQHRLRRGQCPGCAYPAGPSPVCTECGLPSLEQPASRP